MSVFPVGLVTEFGLSSPVVIGGRVTGFYDGWPGGRVFPVDMAGFGSQCDSPEAGEVTLVACGVTLVSY